MSVALLPLLPVATTVYVGQRPSRTRLNVTVKEPASPAVTVCVRLLRIHRTTVTRSS